MKRPSDTRGDAWQLLVRFFFAQRAHMPSLAADLELSPAQCHVLHLIEPGQVVAIGHLVISTLNESIGVEIPNAKLPKFTLATA